LTETYACPATAGVEVVTAAFAEVVNTEMDAVICDSIELEDVTVKVTVATNTSPLLTDDAVDPANTTLPAMLVFSAKL